ncbi:MAG TPA: thioredoxin fold domain-containing protein [Armatimonadetes bacterium]|jgi:thioredoxin-related protein|nr:thioredoxin fold domain-containing protein [Armatimonadota bacterium]
MVLTAVVGLLALSSTAQAAEMPWRTSVEDALAEAAKSDKLVMIDFSDTDCVWCDRMDSETLADTTVVTACERVIPVRVYVEEMPDLARKHEIEGVPSFIFVESSGDEAGRIVGFLPPEEFIHRLDLVLQEQERVVNLRKRVAAEPQDMEAKAELARIYCERRQGDLAAPLVDALSALPKEDAPEDMADILLNTGIAYGSRGNNDRALVYLDRVIKNYPDTEEAEWASFFTGLALGLKGEREAAIKQLEQVISTAKNEGIRERARILRDRFQAVDEQAPPTGPSL